MGTMDGFDHILNWTLRVGSHPFPGSDGGTCINEAAIVAAGFAYQPVRQVEDMPECFSRPICRLAMQLNDQASDEERQQLLPFVTRLACADTPEIEHQRAAYIQARLPYPFTFRRVLPCLKVRWPLVGKRRPLGWTRSRPEWRPYRGGRPRLRRVQAPRSCPSSRAGSG